MRALDHRPVNPDQERKSVSAEDTFSSDLSSEEELLPHLQQLCHLVAQRLQKAGTEGRTVTLKIKYHDFITRTRSHTLPHYIDSEASLLEVARDLLHRPTFPSRPVRLLGVGVSTLRLPGSEEPGGQLKLDF